MTTKLLAVDDSKTMRRVLEITFSGDDFKATICGSAAEALQAIRGDRPEVALVDASLAGDSGYELCRQIKAEAPDVRVLILSSKHRPYDERQGAGVAADAHFDKPFDSTKLIEKVKSMVGATAPVAAAPVRPAPFAATQLATPSRGPATPSAAPAASRPVLGGASTRPAVPTQTSVAPRPSPTAAPRPAPEARPAAAPPLQRAPAAPAAATAAAVSSPQFSDKLKELGLSAAQVEGVLSLSRDVVEQVVWEVVPALAETLIKEEIARLTAG